MFTTLNLKKIHYQVGGEGTQTIILVHGWGGSIKSLDKLAELLKKQYRVVQIDLPGFGQSENPNSDWGIDELSKIVLNLLDSLKIKKTIFFGHSFGGSLGIYLAANYPDRISHLVLCNSSYKRTAKKSNPTKFLKGIFAIIPLINRFENIVKYFYYKIFFPNSDLIKFPALESNFKKIMQQDLTEFLAKIKTPTLILWGQNDTQTPVELTQTLKTQIKGSKLKIFPNIGHNLPLLYPDKVYGELDKFL